MRNHVRIMTVIGTRPEAIKMAPLVQALKVAPWAESLVCTTGQHRQMLDQVLGVFGITPDRDLDVMRHAQSLTTLTASILERLGPVIDDYRPDLLLVQGDTTTTFAAAMTASYRKIAVGHVEAGLRTADKASPWPEEINRRLTSVLADHHFAPTEQARRNLLEEGVAEADVVVTGNTVIDALLQAVERLGRAEAEHGGIARSFAFLDPARRMILVTGHRREKFGARFEEFCAALRTLAERRDIEIVYPVHLNPNVQEPVHRSLGGHPRIHLIAPQDYLPFLFLMRRCHFIITDSGGVQEEAPSLGKPVLVTRDTTERPEALAVGTVKLVGFSGRALVEEATRLLDDPAAYETMARAGNPYGDGQASRRIVAFLQQAYRV